MSKSNKKTSKKKFNGAVLKNLRIENGFDTPQALFLAIHHKTGTTIAAQSIENHENGTHEPRLAAIMEYSSFFGVDATAFFQFNDDDSQPNSGAETIEDEKHESV